MANANVNVKDQSKQPVPEPSNHWDVRMEVQLAQLRSGISRIKSNMQSHEAQDLRYEMDLALDVLGAELRGGI